MSIPKEPRQLMINLMYLVLTAMLALNVSAEIINAFFDLDKSLQKSAKVAADGSKITYESAQSALNKKPALQKVLNAAMSESTSRISQFTDYVDGIRAKLIDQSAGGNNNGVLDSLDFDHGMPKGKKDKDVTTRLLAEGPDGAKLEKEVNQLKLDLTAIFKKAATSNEVLEEKKGAWKKADADAFVDAFVKGMVLDIDESWKLSDKKSWADYKFRQMPLAAALPTLSKFQSDARAAQADINNKLAGIIGTFELKLDKFFPVLAAKQGYVIEGEKFEAEVAIGSYSSQFAKTSSLTVDGQGISLNSEGKGTYSKPASGIGKKKINLSCTVRNPLTGESFSGTSEFEYEVGRRSAALSADKMNVFYIGVENPISVAVAGASSNQINVSGSGGGINISGSGTKYVVKASTPGEAVVKVSAPGITQDFPFRVKRIPDPRATLGGQKLSSGAMGSGEMKAQQMVFPYLENFDFEANCTIDRFTCVRIAKRSDPQAVQNSGQTLNQAKALTSQATPGDVYMFDDIYARCPGDVAGRKLNSMSWRIK